MLNVEANLETRPAFCSQGKDCFSLGSLLQRDFFSLSLSVMFGT